MAVQKPAQHAIGCNLRSDFPKNIVMPHPADTCLPGGQPVFATTRWSLVLAAGREARSSGSALEQLCEAYWYPIYHFVRRQGRSTHDAQDLTQEFFARLLAGNWIAKADPARGRFRSFLLVMLKRFLAGQWERAQAQKRGAGRPHLALEDAESRFLGSPCHGTPEEAFDQHWALTLLDRALRDLRAEYERDGRGVVFETLKGCLTAAPDARPYADLGAALGLSEGAVKVAVHRLRERYREKLRAEIAQTVAGPSEVDAEMRHLVRVLARM
jgi:RNA polymerase sigma factor (sigma-70 family)